MKTSQLLKIALVPILAISTLLSVSHTALADYLRGNGRGGDYIYELWSTDDGSSYYLKIWSDKEDTQKNPFIKTKLSTNKCQLTSYNDIKIILM
jgi:hypothetical protein